MQKNYRLNPLIVPAIVAVGLTTEKLLPTALMKVHTLRIGHSIGKYFVVFCVCRNTFIVVHHWVCSPGSTSSFTTVCHGDYVRISLYLLILLYYIVFRCVGHEQADSCVGVYNPYVLHFALTIS